MIKPVKRPSISSLLSIYVSIIKPIANKNECIILQIYWRWQLIWCLVSRKCSQITEGARFVGFRIPSLIYVDDQSSSNIDLQLALGWFMVQSKAAGIRISTSEFDAMVLSKERVDCPLRAEEKLLLRVEEFNYFVVKFTNHSMFQPSTCGHELQVVTESM